MTDWSLCSYSPLRHLQPSSSFATSSLSSAMDCNCFTQQSSTIIQFPSSSTTDTLHSLGRMSNSWSLKQGSAHTTPTYPTQHILIYSPIDFLTTYWAFLKHVFLVLITYPLPNARHLNDLSEHLFFYLIKLPPSAFTANIYYTSFR